MSTTTVTSQNTSAINKSDSFDSFLCDVSGVTPGPTLVANQSTSETTATNGSANSTISSLEKEEKDFFNQSINNGVTDKGKLTKDSILALYGMNSFAAAPQPAFPTQMPGTAAFGYAPPQQPTNPQMFPNMMIGGGPPQMQQPDFFNFGTRLPMQQGQFMNLNHNNSNNNNFGNFASFPGTSSTANPYQQQFNTQKLNEDNIKKIESLSLGFNNLK